MALRLYSIHNHTTYSNTRFPDAINSPADLILNAYKKDNAGVSFSDHQSLSGCFQAQRVIDRLKNTYPNMFDHFKVTFGDEIYLVDRTFVNKQRKIEKNYKQDLKNFYKAKKQGKQADYPHYPSIQFFHFVLTARNARGFELLEKVNANAWQNAFTYGKFNRQLRVPTYKDWLKKAMQNYKGDVIASTACLGSETSKDILSHNTKDLHSFLRYLVQVFGKNNVYFELMPSLKKQQQIVNNALWNLSKKTGIKTIISTDSHYTDFRNKWLHQMFLLAQSDTRDVPDFYKYAHLFSYKDLTKSFFGKTYFAPIVLKASVKNSMNLLKSIQQINLHHVKTSSLERQTQIMNGERAEKVNQKYAKKVHSIMWNVGKTWKNFNFDLNTDMIR